MKLKTIIVEDELLGQEALAGILKNFCSESIEVVAIAATVEEASQAIQQLNPDLVFLDIRLGNNDKGAFDILRALEKINFKIVFTTSSEQTDNILKAINKYCARKYLLKPLDIDEVISAVELVRNEQKTKDFEKEFSEIRNLLTTVNKTETEQKLQLPIKHGFQYIPYDNIVMFRSNQNSTLVFLLDGTSVNSSKNLKYFEAVLSKTIFSRVSKSFIINLNKVIKYSSEDGGTIYLHADCSAALSDKYKKDFFENIGIK